MGALQLLLILAPIISVSADEIYLSKSCDMATELGKGVAVGAETRQARSERPPPTEPELPFPFLGTCLL